MTFPDFAVIQGCQVVKGTSSWVDKAGRIGNSNSDNFGSLIICDFCLRAPEFEIETQNPECPNSSVEEPHQHAWPDVAFVVPFVEYLDMTSTWSAFEILDSNSRKNLLPHCHNNQN